MAKKMYRMRTNKGFVYGSLSPEKVIITPSGEMINVTYHKDKYKEWGSLGGVQDFRYAFGDNLDKVDAVIQELEYTEAKNLDYLKAVNVGILPGTKYIAYSTSTKKYYSPSKGFGTNKVGAKLFDSIEKLKKSITEYYAKIDKFNKSLVGITDARLLACPEFKPKIVNDNDPESWKIIEMKQEATDFLNAMDGYDPTHPHYEDYNF